MRRKEELDRIYETIESIVDRKDYEGLHIYYEIINLTNDEVKYLSDKAREDIIKKYDG